MRNTALHIYQTFRPRRLLDSVAIIITLLVVVLLVSMGSIFTQMTFDIVDKQTRKRAIQTARQFALLPDVKQFIQNVDQTQVQNLNEIIREQTDVAYIIITDKNGSILRHPNAALIGSKLLDPLATRALRFGSDYSRRTLHNGSHFILGSVPVLDERYSIIGMVSAGIPEESMRKASDRYLERIVFFTFVFITLGLMAAIFIARGVKWVIFGLEPTEIAYMFQERTALLESIREGIISTDAKGTITLVNEPALRTLHLSDKAEMVGKSLNILFPKVVMADILSSEEPIIDREMIIRGTTVIVNVSPVGGHHGLVISFRRKEDIDMIVKELSQVQTFSEMLRAQTHEYANSLHTIVGLIQIGAYDDVLDFIADETRGHRRLIRFLAENLPDRILSSMLIGKYMHASEQKVTMKIDPESRMIDLPDQLDRHTLTTALGNIIDNGIEAALSNAEPPWITLSMSDFGHDLIFEVEDSGPGVPPEIIEKIFTKGFSTKGDGQRGYGLYLASRAIETLGGKIYVSDADTGGSRFEVIIPKDRHQI